MKTNKLFYADTHLAEFSALVVDCFEGKQGFEIELDRTAFYPEGGGQAADKGTINGIEVLHVHEDGERVLHRMPQPLPIGETVEGTVDYAHRFDLMQQHTGEHIVSGIINARYGYHNVGFHMGWESITIDFDGIIPPEELPELERLANGAIYQNIPLKIWTPSPEELPGVFYRTKRELPWPVRIVNVPGYDSCACCGLHVERTGEIGLIKLFSCVRFRSGSRIEMLCGQRAFDFLSRNYEQNKQVSAAFSAKLLETGDAARKMNGLLEEQKRRIGELETEGFRAAAARCSGLGDVLLLREGLDSVGVRKLADLTAEVCGGTAAVFSENPGGSFAYCLLRKGGDLRSFNKAMTAALNGRGGGKPECQMGSVRCGREAVLKHFVSFSRPE
ncbi:MAG: alanyl-tRNA editing protein [Oscillospiraceae bacterium]|nr:alanyl-tRNA editing protein [Oscillospiraceae bacterium]